MAQFDQGPSVSKSNWLHVDISPMIFLYSFEVYSINSCFERHSVVSQTILVHL